jgi:hypothetical protein
MQRMGAASRRFPTMSEDFPMIHLLHRCGATGRLAVLAFVLAWAFAGHSSAAEAKPQYNRDIRPILAENCFACHGPDKMSRKAGLRLDIRAKAVDSGAIVPGKPDESALVERIFSTDRRDMMPPPKSLKKLNPEQKKLLRAWIASGAEYQAHWSFIPPTRPELPAVKNTSWVRNGIDRFILAALEKRGLTPAPEADRRTLARRAALDLTGLPPPAEEVEAFVKDGRPDAYERYVDRLLASPFWGEHRGRYWLDYSRYADTHGIHFDNYREIWSYRDWVIRAFNQNQSFDQFTIEQLAGDLLPNPTLDQRVASGFNRCNITTNEGGVIPEEYLVLYTRDRTETVSQVWLGLTAGCAVCHDHKLDPISQREFYRMAAFFNNTTQGAMDGNIKDTPPIIMVPRNADRARLVTLQKQLADAKAKVEQHRKSALGGFGKWLESAKAETIQAGIPGDRLHLRAILSEGSGLQVGLSVDGKARSVDLPPGQGWTPGYAGAKAFQTRPGATVEAADVGDFEKDQAFSFGAWVRLPRSRFNGAVFARMDEKDQYRGWDLWVEGGRFGSHIINRWPQDALKVVAGNPVAHMSWNHVFVTYDGSGKVAGLRVYVNGVLQTNRNIQADSLKSTIRTKVPWKLATRNSTSRLDGISVQDVRIYLRELNAQEVARLAKGTRAAYLVTLPKRTPIQNNELFDWYLAGGDRKYQELLAGLEKLQREQAGIGSRGTVAHVMQERGDKATAYILYRGDYDKRRDPVTPDTPSVLPALPGKLPRNRLGFAEWLVQPGHPLTARVTVNRFWQEVFGTGIVRTSGDFGTAGELPSHPELLDWLALEFSEKGWDVKRFFRMLVTSAAYRQAAITTAEKHDKDPHNTFLSRGPRFRMDAEMIRDHALAASGLLVPRFGGPSVRPYQPEGVWEAVAMIGSNTRDYKRDRGDNLYRRSMYTFWKRAAPPASMDIFNAPSRETCTVRRERTNTPLQALVTLNDPQFVEAARVLAEKTLEEGLATNEKRADYIALRLLARPLRSEEQKVVQRMLAELLTHYKENAAETKKLLGVGERKPNASLDAGTLAAWTMLTNALMNLDEVLNK